LLLHLHIPVTSMSLSFEFLGSNIKLELICKQRMVDTIREATIGLKTNSACNVQNKSTKKSFHMQCRPEASHLGDMLLCKRSMQKEASNWSKDHLMIKKGLLEPLVNSRYLPGITSLWPFAAWWGSFILFCFSSSLFSLTPHKLLLASRLVWLVHFHTQVPSGLQSGNLQWRVKQQNFPEFP